jgi:hypothetical protein
MESELVRGLIEVGGTAAARCLAWLVDGAAALPEARVVDVVWPAAPVVL